MPKDESSPEPIKAAKESGNLLAPFNPTCHHAQDVALEMLDLNENDVLFDLGCGDAKLLLNAVRRVSGVRCVGMEIDRIFVDKAIAAVRQLPSEQQHRIDIRLQDVLQKEEVTSVGIASSASSTVDLAIGSACRDLRFHDATALFLYLLPKGLVRIKALLDKIVKERKGSLRIVTYMFKIHGWIPTKIDQTTKGGAPVYLYEFNN